MVYLPCECDLHEAHIFSSLPATYLLELWLKNGFLVPRCNFLVEKLQKPLGIIALLCFGVCFYTGWQILLVLHS